MFDDIMDAKIPIHPDIMEAAVEWAEYEMTRIIKKRTTLMLDGIQNEIKEMLKERLGRFWWKEYEAKLDMEAIKDGREIKIKWRKINVL